MAYDLQAWLDRHRSRSDITSRVTHLTREATIEGQPRSAVQVLAKILNEGRLIGSTTESGFIVGPRPAVCFQAAPLLGLAENIKYEENAAKATKRRIRYRGVGVSFHKAYASLRGARPVIYERTEVSKKLLPADEHWRIVDLEYRDTGPFTDWTHEREWRAPGDFCFDLRHALVIVDTSLDFRALLEEVDVSVLKQLTGITVLKHAIA